ncbi:MAG: TlpA disulfide reductase family protein [Ignavibacteriaceae bacterium]
MNGKIRAFLLLIAANLFLSSCSAQMQPPDLPDISEIESFTKADHSLTFYNLDGEQKKLGDFKDSVVFLNIWATWCPPCLEEMPSIQRLYNKVSSTDIAFILISPEKEEVIKNYLDKEGYTFDVYLLKDELPKVFYSGQVPTTYLIDKKGNIVLTHIGYAIWDDESVVRFLEELSNNH